MNPFRSFSIVKSASFLLLVTRLYLAKRVDAGESRAVSLCLLISQMCLNGTMRGTALNRSQVSRKYDGKLVFNDRLGLCR